MKIVVRAMVWKCHGRDLAQELAVVREEVTSTLGVRQRGIACSEPRAAAFVVDAGLDVRGSQARMVQARLR